MRPLWISALAVLLCVGCTGFRVEFQQPPLREIDRSAGHPVEAEASGFQLLLWIPIGVNERHQEAWRRLEAQAPGEYITDIQIQDSWTYALIGTIYTVRLEAVAYPYVSPGA